MPLPRPSVPFIRAPCRAHVRRGQQYHISDNGAVHRVRPIIRRADVSGITVTGCGARRASGSDQMPVHEESEMPHRSSRFRRASLPAFALAMALSVPVMAQHVATTVDIGRLQPGLEPEGFTFGRTGQGAPGEWRVVADPTATAQKAIAQTNKDTTDYRFPLAVYTAVSAKNVDVTVRFKSVAGQPHEPR